MRKIKALAIGAAKSGAGKTTITIGIQQALKRRGYSVQPFKCGPDFIDPSLHTYVTGRNSYNLDLRMMGQRCCKELFSEHGGHADISVVEGVMGLYDGGEASTASLAKALDIPVVLIIDASSCAESNGAVLVGFEQYDPELKIGGVIFNKIGSARHQQLILQAVENKTNIPIIGFMPRDVRFEIPSRHLGLLMGSEQPLSAEELDGLAETVEEHLDLDQIINFEGAIRAASVRDAARPTFVSHGKRPRIGVARDEPFCFYYQQNFEILQHAGIELVPFSPLHDSSVPDACDMIYIGGGYPELYAKQLSENSSMLDSIRALHHNNIPIYGECGGFMYLCNRLIDLEGLTHRMAGLFPFTTRMNKRLRKLGYRNVELLRDSILGKKGSHLFGHEFHYSAIESNDNGERSAALVPLYKLDNNSYEGYHCGSAIGSYIHLHFGKVPEMIERLTKQLTS